MMGVRLLPLEAPFGREALGLDLSGTPSEADWAATVGAYWEHHLLLVRGLEIDLDEQVSFVSHFGTVRPPLAQFQPEGHTELASYVSNVKGFVPNSGEYMLHRDDTYTEDPCVSMCLHAQEVTSHGGETIFVDAERAYQSLSDATKARIADMHSIHIGPDPAVSAKHPGGETLQKGFRAFGGSPSTNIHAVWPVVRPHPVTGRPVLYIDGSSFYSFEGLTPEDSEDLYKELLSTFDDPEHSYRHTWRVGDTLLWDNVSLLHARTSFHGTETRTLRKLLVAGPRDEN
jgi:taurine dioxygenase